MRHLGRVEAEVDPDDGLPLVDQRLHLVLGCARPRQRLRDLLVAIEVLHVGFGRDDRHELRAALGGLADVHELHAVGGRVEHAEVLGDLLVRGQRVIGARCPADDALGSRHVGLRGGRHRRDRQQRQDGENVRPALHGVLQCGKVVAHRLSGSAVGAQRRARVAAGRPPGQGAPDSDSPRTPTAQRSVDRVHRSGRRRAVHPGGRLAGDPRPGDRPQAALPPQAAALSLVSRPHALQLGGDVRRKRCRREHSRQRAEPEDPAPEPLVDADLQ